MKNLESKFVEIESQEFSGLVNLTSSLGPVCRAAREELAVHVVWQELTSSKEARLDVFGRIVELCHLETDFRYENSYDAALAVYLWLLGAADPLAATPQSLGYLAAGIILGTPRLWWAEKLARREYERRNFLNGSGSHVVVAQNENTFYSTVDFWPRGRTLSFGCSACQAGDVGSHNMLIANITRGLEPILVDANIAAPKNRPDLTVSLGPSPAPS